MRMRYQQRFLMMLGLCLALLGATWAWAATSPEPSARPASGKQALPGVEAAQTLSTITGVAISPLLGVGGYGFYHWWKTPDERRGRLPWYARPWFWAPALFLVAVIGVKDILGTAAPSALKKPFDVAEAIENKISALVVAGAFIPLIISVFPGAAADGAWSPADVGFAAIGASQIGNVLLIPLALAVFVVVFMASHAINILILLSPFTTVDTALKTLRVGVLALVAATSLASPYVGAAVSAAIIVFCYLIAGWSFRLGVFGTVYVWDYVTFRRCRFQAGAEFNRCFTARRIEDVPVRTYGKLSGDAERGLRFTYRPLLFLGTRTLTLPREEYVIGRGLFCPELDRVVQERPVSVLIFPPRFLTHEDALARTYAVKEVRDIGVLKGLRSAWKWCRGLFRSSPELPVSTVQRVPG